jgi:hypothetical protein
MACPILAEKVLTGPICGHLFVSLGCRGDVIKVVWFDGEVRAYSASGLKGRFVWPCP